MILAKFIRRTPIIMRQILAPLLLLQGLLLQGCFTDRAINIPSENKYTVRAYDSVIKTQDRLLFEFTPKRLSSNQKASPSDQAYVGYDILKSEFGDPVWAEIPGNLKKGGSEIKLVPYPSDLGGSKFDDFVRAPSGLPLRLFKAGLDNKLVLAQYDPASHACIETQTIEAPVFSVKDEWAGTRKVIFTPFAVVADILTSPIQLAYFLIYCNDIPLAGRRDCRTRLPWN